MHLRSGILYLGCSAHFIFGMMCLLFGMICLVVHLRWGGILYLGCFQMHAHLTFGMLCFLFGMIRLVFVGICCNVFDHHHHLPVSLETCFPLNVENQRPLLWNSITMIFLFLSYTFAPEYKCLWFVLTWSVLYPLSWILYFVFWRSLGVFLKFNQLTIFAKLAQPWNLIRTANAESGSVQEFRTSKIYKGTHENFWGRKKDFYLQREPFIYAIFLIHRMAILMMAAMAAMLD